MLLDGKLVSSSLIDDLKPRISYLQKYGITPKLNVILVGDDEGSKMYVTMKRKKCEELNILCNVIQFPSSIQTDKLIETINHSNTDDSVHGVMVQLPLPKHIQKNKVLDTIIPSKDVDGLSSSSLGILAKGTPLFSPCTPLGCIRLFEYYKIPLMGMKVTLIGSSPLVGLPLSLLLLYKGATVTVCNINTKNTKEHTLNSDIVISCCGVPHLVKEDWIKEGAIVIDIGISKVNGEVIGDVDFHTVHTKCQYITPVPGGVGPMTIAILMEQVVQSAEHSSRCKY